MLCMRVAAAPLHHDRNKSSLIKRQFYNARLPRGSLLITRYNYRPSTALDNYSSILPRGCKVLDDLRKQFRATTCPLRHERSVTQSPIQKEQHLSHVCTGLPRAEIIFANLAVLNGHLAAI